MQQVNEVIRHKLAELLLEELNFPPGCFVTIINVQTSKDLSVARITVSILPKNRQGSLFAALQQQASRLQFLLSKHVVLRKIPRLNFQLDHAQEYVDHINELIDKIHTSR